MRLLVLGGGAREHALVWKLKQSPLVSALFAAPGNPGIAAHAELVAIDANEPRAVTAFAVEKRIDLVVVGPEAPLVAGVADALRAAGVEVFGPGRAAAQVEGSKAFAKDVMLAAGVPTARSEVFDDAQAAAARAKAWGAVVVKADGLAAGKGVVVADTGEEAAAACLALGRLPAGKRILLEERLEGPELSVIALCDGVRFVLLPPSQDHKRVFDGDQGPNTGGMGAYAPADFLSAAELEAVGQTVIAPTLAELAQRGAEFRGALYAGLMLTKQGPKVLEFNARLGDPETQPLMMMVKDDLVPFLQACARGRLEAQAIDTHSGAAVGVVMAAHGYPGTPRAGDELRGLDAPRPPGVQIFHAGTRQVDGKLVTSGGRVLTVCAQAESIAAARALAYQVAEQIHFEGRHFRRDIAAKAPVR
ncbi:MAG: phosphoribosylamine--glycine ligase [Myxococcota bacterium]